MLHYNPNIHRCEHIKVNGTQCGSPAMRHQRLCYFHLRWHEERIAISNQGVEQNSRMSLPILEDADAIQLALMQTLNLLLSGQIEHKTAALLLYGFQTASANVRRTSLDPYPPRVVVDPTKVGQTAMGEDVWKNSDFGTQEKRDKECERDSPKKDAFPLLTGLPAEKLVKQVSEDLPANWREELRTKIAERVRHEASKGLPDEKSIHSSEIQR